MKNLKHKFLKKFTYIITLIIYFCPVSIQVYANEKLVIVIDAGHGGENEGADFYGIKEKDITLKVAVALKDELSKYNNIETYITRTEDKDISLKQRADFAKDCKADMLLSIHFNASEVHDRFGSEVWLSSVGKYYNESYGIAYNLLEEFKKLGLNSRGIKTRIGSGEKDYYGIIRNSVENDIPAMIVEHCFMDNENDTPYLSDEMYIKFAQADTNAIISYYNSDRNNKTAFSDNEIIYPDTTPPEDIKISITQNSDNSTATLNISATEKESNLAYFDYSLDNGTNWFKRIAWGEGKSINQIINLNKEDITNINVRVYNGYDMYDNDYIKFIPQLEQENKEKEKFSSITNITILFSISIILTTILILIFINKVKLDKRR